MTDLEHLSTQELKAILDETEQRIHEIRAELDEREAEVLVRSLMSQFEQFVQLGKKVPAEVVSSLSSIEEPGRLVDTMAAHLSLKLDEKQKILEILPLRDRVEHVLGVLDGRSRSVSVAGSRSRWSAVSASTI